MPIEFFPFELHTHTLHSDGSFTPKELAEHIAEAGLCGFSLTDHNVITGAPYAMEAARDLGLVFLPGIEWTTFFGHITVLGGDYNIDWRTVNSETVRQKAAEVKSKGGCVGIAHPFRIGYPICTGGSDDWGIEDYRDFTHYEIWSYLDPSAEPTNAQAENRYRALAATGNRLACVYGKDWHRGSGGLFAATFLGIEGKPDQEKAIAAVREGRSYVSLGIRLDAALSDSTGRTYHIGEEAPAGEYTLNISIDVPSEGFGSGRTYLAETVSLYSGGGEEVFLLCGNRFKTKIEAKRGFLQLAVDGKVDGLSRRLLVATPIYIK